MENYLVVGGDGGIGFALREAIKIRGGEVRHTTRRKSRNNIFLDLEYLPENLNFLENYTCAFLCAGRTGYVDCKNNPLSTHKVNVEGIVAVAEELVDKGSFVVFLSSSAVFDGKKPWPNEDAEYAPISEYGRQKVATEKQLLKLDQGRNNIAIVRMTKVLTNTIPIINRFMRLIESESPVDALSDLKMAPISMPYVVKSLLHIGVNNVGGIYHLSGDVELSYSDLASDISQLMNVDPMVVRGVSSSASRAYITPDYPGLGMARTSHELALKPQSIKSMYEDLLAEYYSVNRMSSLSEKYMLTASFSNIDS